MRYKKLESAKGAFLALVGVVVLSLVSLGCGSLTNSGSSSSQSGQLRLQGKYNLTISPSSIGTQATPAITAIVAVTSDGTKSLATLSNGTFSLNVKKGFPTLLGFFNGTSLVGYLAQKDVDWQSLPLMNPKETTTDLGTVEVSTATREATPSVALNDLISKMNMTSDSATAYGRIDNPMTVFTNLDVDGNGTFDFQEGKSFLFWADYQFKTSSQISKMIGEFNEAYTPQIESYTYALIFLDENKKSTAGVSASLSAPGALASTSFAGTSADRPAEWVYGFGPVTAVSTPPSGQYVATVTGYGTLTFNNFQPATVSRIGASENIVYPVLKLSTNEAGEVTKVSYKWKIIQSGTARDATAAEITSQVEDTQKSTTAGFIHGSPFIGFQFKSDGKGTTPIMLDRDGTSLDITTVPIEGGTTRKVLLSDIQDLSITYNLTTRAVHRFHFSQ